MNLNADFNVPAAVHAARLEWKPSPVPGVKRRMLDRIGEEVARATSLVQYAPRSRFSPHTHDGGEEFFVLEGVFQDEHGDFADGSYIRNPPGSSHAPGSTEGCTIFVKLWQFDPLDRSGLRLETKDLPFAPVIGRNGVGQIALFEDTHEKVRLERWLANVAVDVPVPGGLELLVLSGSFVQDREEFVKHSWLRLPPGSALRARAGAEGAQLWIKSGHLRNMPKLPSAARFSYIPQRANGS